MYPWWYEYVQDAIDQIDQKDYQEARALLAEIIQYALDEEND